jgi:hypothetical protein
VSERARTSSGALAGSESTESFSSDEDELDDKRATSSSSFSSLSVSEDILNPIVAYRPFWRDVWCMNMGKMDHSQKVAELGAERT